MHWTEISERRAEGGVVILHLRGHLTLSEEDKRLIPAIAALLDDGCRSLLLNLGQLAFIDSQGIGEIVGAYTRMTRQGGALKLCEVSPRVREVLRATNLDALLEMFETEVEALQAF